MIPGMNFYLAQYYLSKPFISWRNKYLKSKTRKEAKQLKLYDKAVQELEAYTHEGARDICQKHQQSLTLEPGARIFDEQSSLSKASVERFYQQCKYYLYELPLWNAEINRPAYLYLIVEPFLKKYACRKVLDFGGGTGDLCLELAKHALEVTYCDIGEDVYNFACWRFEQRGHQVAMAKGLAALKGGSFDAVISFDCFEHLKDLPSVVAELSLVIRPGGLLITSDAFSGGGLHLEENQKYGVFKNYDHLMNSAGLVFVGRFAQYFFYKKIK